MKLSFSVAFNRIIFLRSTVKSFCLMSERSKVYVKHLDSEDKLKIYFRWPLPNGSDRMFTFLRPKKEELSTTQARISHKLTEFIASKLKKNKRKRTEERNEENLIVSNVLVSLCKENEVISGDVKNIDAWTDDSQLKIDDTVLDIEVNPPTVVHLTLPKSILAGFPVYPSIELEFCSKNMCQFAWYRSFIDENISGNKIQNCSWEFLSNNFFYVTSESDIGAKLKMSCIPISSTKHGMLEETVSPNAVVLGPGKCPFDNRHNFTKELTDDYSLRCISYNILADYYADTDTARNELFPYCPPEFLMLDYRKQLYLKEIIGYNADIICLQEVDKKVFYGDLTPVLSSIKLEGIYNAKGGQVAEGLACFYRNTKFRLIESNAILLNEAMKTEPIFETLLSKLSENEKLLERFMNRSTILQTVLLESLFEPKKRILIGNTHLYFHPESDNIRLLQATTCMLYLENIVKTYKKKVPLYTSMIFCGDFNSCPEFGVYEFITTKSLSQHCIDWQSNPLEKVEGMPLSHSLTLDSACGRREYTNFTQEFKGCLDYIFYDKSSLEVTQMVPLPQHEDVTKYTALPSKIFPSDHIALVCTLKWK